MSPKRQKRLKPDEIDELVDLYESEMSVNQLAKRVKIHRTTVMAHLKRRGVKTRPAFRKLKDQQAQQAADLYEAGLSLKAVAIRFDVDAETIRSELIRLGIGRRTPRISS